MEKIDINELLLSKGYKPDENKIYVSGNTGYWSNLNKEDNKRFLELMGTKSAREAVEKVMPHLEKMIYSEKREAALELLDIESSGICVDYGCMWGVLSVGMAKRGYKVISMDQTYESLKFLSQRSIEEKLPSIFPVQDDIRKTSFNEEIDVALVNGVLEWIPESGDIEIGKYYGKKTETKTYTDKPLTMQKDFLSSISRALRPNGQMLLAIENRYDYSRIIGKKDPHANIYFTSFLPRCISNMISKIALGRPYRNYIYSFMHLKKIVLESGFSNVELYMSFPDYHFPELILPYEGKGINEYDKYPNEYRITRKQRIAYYFEYMIMKVFKAKYFSPAIMLIARK